MSIRIFLAILLVVITASGGFADMMYEWVDENGVVTLRDTPPPGSTFRKRTYNPSTLLPDRSSSPARTSKGARAVASKPARERVPFTGTVEIYVTSWCPVSKKALDYLKEKNIPHVAYDIETDLSAKQRHKELGGKGIPLIVIGSHKIRGFSAAAVDQYMKDSGD